MNFATAVTKLFADGDVGQSLLTELGLPVESFPAAATWNQFTAHSDAEKVALRKHTAAAAPYEPNKSYLTPESNAKLLTRFVDLNAGVVRFTPSYRLWTSDDIYAAPQRWSGGCSLMMLSVYRPDGTFSAPFLCITGPMATPLLGKTYDTRDIFGLSATDLLPTIHGASITPKVLAPTTVSVASSSRKWIEDTSPSQLLLESRTKGHFLTILDSQSLHTTVPILDTSDHLSHRVHTERQIQDAGIWTKASTDGKFEPEPNIMRAWLRDSVIPPDPRSGPIWYPKPIE
jgi:hypothetical protein